MKRQDHWRDNLREYSINVDKEKLWSQTSHAIPKNRKRRALLFWVPLATGVSVILFLLGSNADFLKQINASEATHEIFNNTTSNLDEVQNPESASNNNKIPESSIQNNIESKENSTSPPQQINSETISPKNRVASQNDQTLNTTKSASVKKVLPTGPSGKQENILQAQPAIVEHSHPIISETVDMMQISNNPALYTNENNPSTGNNHIDNETPVRETYIPVVPLITKVEKVSSEINSEITSDIYQPHPIAPGGYRVISIQALQRVGLSAMTIHSLHPDAADLAEQLKKYAKSMESIATSISVGLPVFQKNRLDLGATYSRLTTQLSHTETSSKIITREGITSIIIDENGIAHPVTGNVQVIQNETLSAKRFTEHHNIDIDATLHLQLWEYKKYKLNAFVKGAYNVWYSGKGSVLNEESNLMRFTYADNPYVRKSPFTYGTGCEFQYALHPKWKIILRGDYEPVNYKLDLPGKPIEWRHKLFHAGIGLSYKV